MHVRKCFVSYLLELIFRASLRIRERWFWRRDVDLKQEKWLQQIKREREGALSALKSDWPTRTGVAYPNISHSAGRSIVCRTPVFATPNAPVQQSSQPTKHSCSLLIACVWWLKQIQVFVSMNNVRRWGWSWDANWCGWGSAVELTIHSGVI